MKWIGDLKWTGVDLTHMSYKKDTPFNDRVIQIVKEMEEHKIKSGMKNLKHFEDLLNL